MKINQTWEEEVNLIPKDTKNKHKYMRRRRTSPGYPVQPRKFTYDEIKAYQSTDKITCLLCGNQLETLAKHLRYVHNISITEYKDMYGLPNKRGLSGKTARRNYAKAQLNKLPKCFTDPIIREGIRKEAVVAAQHQKMQPFRSELSRKHIAKGSPFVKNK
jgi:predicted transcriptional regulator